jgi:hypothetical protein
VRGGQRCRVTEAQDVVADDGELVADPVGGQPRQRTAGFALGVGGEVSEGLGGSADRVRGARLARGPGTVEPREGKTPDAVDLQVQETRELGALDPQVPRTELVVVGHGQLLPRRMEISRRISRYSQTSVTIRPKPARQDSLTGRPFLMPCSM